MVAPSGYIISAQKEKDKKTPMSISIEKIFSFLKKLLSTSTLITIVLVILILTPKYAFFHTQAGYIYHYQNLITGETKVYDKPGTYFRVPYFSHVTPYVQVWSVKFGKASDSRQTSPNEHKSITLIFADMTTATIPANFLFEIDQKQFKQSIVSIHKDFTSFEEMINLLLITTLRKAMLNKATPYLGKKFLKVNRCLNQFKLDLEYDLKVKHQTELQPSETEIPIEAKHKTELQPSETEIPIEAKHQTELQPSETKIPIEADCFEQPTPNIQTLSDGKHVELPFDKYGIRVTQIIWGSPIPGPLLESKLYDERNKEAAKGELETEKAKQNALLEKEIAIKEREDKIADQEHKLAMNAKKREAKIVEMEQEFALDRKIKEQAITQEHQNLALERMKNEEKIAEQQHHLAMLIKKNEITFADKQKELLKKTIEIEAQEAEKANQLAKIEKAKELASALADRDIQKAKFEAAQFEAKAIREKGIAETDVLKAKYEALIPEIYLAEIKRDIAQVIYPNLKGIEVTMPRNIVNLGEYGDKLQTNLDILSSFATIGVMEGLEKKALEADTAAMSSETSAK